MTDYVTADDREALVASVLAANPDAAIAAADQVGLFVPLPTQLAAEGRPALVGQGAIHLIVPEDRVPMLKAWEQCVRGGVAEVAATLASREGATFHFVDVRERYGTYLVILVPSVRTERRRRPLGTDVGPVRPRLAVTLRNELASFVAVDDATTAMLGWRIEDLATMVGLDLIHPDDHDRALENWLEMLADPAVPHRWRGRHRCKDGSWLWMEFTTHNELAEHGRVRSELYDISGEMAAIDALQDRERLLREITEAMPIGVVRLDSEGAIVYVNGHALELLGAVAIANVEELVTRVRPEDASHLARALTDARRARLGSEVQFTIDRGSRNRTIDCRIRPLSGRDDAAADAVLTLVDVTEAMQLRDELERRATTDGLTGIPNRAATLHRLASVAPASAVIYLDIDGFKEVNDRFGHRAGDVVLCSVADRLATAMEDRGYVGRLGGDEFVAVATDAPDPDAALAIARTVASALRYTIPLPSGAVQVRASVGVTWVGDESPADPDVLVARADSAMYRSKEHGRGQAMLDDGR